MKTRKSKVAFLAMAISALSLVACGESDTGKEDPVKKCNHEYGEFTVTAEPTGARPGSKSRTCSLCNNVDVQEIARTGKYTVTIKDAAGATVSSNEADEKSAITKPANPTAPAGKVFYGWKNNKNGGQIWNFENETLNQVMDDVELEPLFIPEGVNPQYLEAELVPAITAGGGMNGATYSGGAKGKQFIRSDDNYELGSTCEIQPFHYYEDEDTFDFVVADEAPAGVDLQDMDPKSTSTGYFVHFNYENGNTFTWNITSSAAVDNVVIFAAFSGEYGVIDDYTFDRYSRFSSTSFPISVNGVDLDYGTVTLHNTPEIGGFIPFQDYLISANVSLREGANVITMKVNNTDTLNGTIASTSPCVDNLKIYTTATITWSEAKLTNIIK